MKGRCSECNLETFFGRDGEWGHPCPGMSDEGGRCESFLVPINDHALTALAGLWRYYESGLDTAGYTSEAHMFEQWAHALESGELMVIESIENAILVLRQNNPEVVVKMLQMFVDGWNRNQEHLEDAVNQACTVEHKCGRNIIQDGALSAYEAAIDWLEDQGRLVRLPGRVERWVWREDAILYTQPVDLELYPSKICQECYEAIDGEHYKGCPTRLIGYES